MRFVLICFALLAVAFYQLSGGNDFVPRSAERQAAAQQIASAAPADAAVETPLDVPVVAVARLPSEPVAAPRPVTVGEDPVQALTAVPELEDTDAPARLFGRDTDLEQPTVSLASLSQNPEDFAEAIEVVSVSADPTQSHCPFHYRAGSTDWNRGGNRILCAGSGRSAVAPEDLHHAGPRGGSLCDDLRY